MAKAALQYNGYRSTTMRQAFLNSSISRNVSKKLAQDVMQSAKRMGFVVMDNSFQSVPLTRMSDRSWKYVNALDGKPVFAPMKDIT